MKSRIVFLYPGQGSQKVGMGLDLYQADKESRNIFDQADNLLGFSLSRICFEGPEEKLARDLNAQLAIYTVSCVLTDLLKAHGITPDMTSGYSSGFYAAAYAAGCFNFAEGLHLVKRAGEILLDEGEKIDGSMAVIFGLSSEKVEKICQKVGHVGLAILNTRRQIIISGLTPSVRKVMEISLQEDALDAYTIPVATAYHSGFMKQSSIRLSEEINLEFINDPLIPLISYLSLKTVPTKGALKDIIARQLSHPVLWVDLIKRLRDNENDLFIEVGPGNVISRTVRWIDRNIEILVTGNKDRLLKAVNRYNRSRSRLEI